LVDASPIAGEFLRQIAQFYMEFYKAKTGRLSCHLHDPSAVIACTMPELMEMEETALSVVTSGEEIGNLVRKTGGGRKCFVCMGVRADALLDEFRRTVALNP
jgi:inosine-uridine nucleoside N-ribohydrolase